MITQMQVLNEVKKGENKIALEEMGELRRMYVDIMSSRVGKYIATFSLEDIENKLQLLKVTCGALKNKDFGKLLINESNILIQELKGNENESN